MENFKEMVEKNYSDFLGIFNSNNRDCAISLIIDLDTNNVHVSTISTKAAPPALKFQMTKANSIRESFVVVVFSKMPEKDEDYDNATYFALPINHEA